MKRFLIALQFLTILPIKITSEIKKEEFGKSLAFFPAVGLCIGLVLAVISLSFCFLPPLVIAAIILAASVIITAGIHLDGFADTCDGLCAFKSKERALEIMRDSHMGAMGVIGIIILLLFKFALLFSLPKENLWRFLILMAVFSRYGQVLCCFSSVYARQEGKAKYFVESARRKDFLVATLFTIALSVLIMNIKGLLVFILSLLVLSFFIMRIKAKIGGMTGDTIGAASEITEVLVLLFALILI